LELQNVTKYDLKAQFVPRGKYTASILQIFPQFTYCCIWRYCLPCDSRRTDKYSKYTIWATADIFKIRFYKFLALCVIGLICQLFIETFRLMQKIL